MIGNLTETAMDEVLKGNVLGRIGCHEGNKTYIVPINYAYDGKSIIAHSAEGLKIDMMRKNPLVCFEIDQMKSFTDWRSVILWGRFEEIMDEDDQRSAMKFFVDRMMHLRLSETAIPQTKEGTDSLRHTSGRIKSVVFRIVITEKTGRFEKE
ncbi:MAG: pyridoxamine 5'-phosphate oxidase family protein [Saprospiraceae bacterium]|uniref:Pyridoxamine 5'-phosphate oxidase family protein n=1 Tax=Candidatus Opimibacter skivensis TaxID=2982028 RepID=A0A9D7T190_9BACT|nr:pyridoxamine 5'-phosphate oxidase family protein [Candidatus Opimibacter skivensis]